MLHGDCHIHDRADYTGPSKCNISFILWVSDSRLILDYAAVPAAHR